MVMCLFCELNPIAPLDFDGLCLSCRAAVADGLYRIEGQNGHRIIYVVPVSEHPLGIEYPYESPMKRYRPELLRQTWAQLARAETTLARLTQMGG